MSYQLIDVNGPIVLSWSLPFEGDLIIADFNNLIVDAESQNAGLSLPIASQGSTGSSAIFNNIGTQPCLLQTFGGNNPTGAQEDYYILPGAIISVYLTQNEDANGIWSIIPFGSGASGIVSITTQAADNSMVITNSAEAPNPTITPPGGTINFATNPSIANLLSLKNTSGGLIAVSKNEAGDLIYNTNAIQAGDNINVSNAKGGSSYPTINLNTDLTSLSSLSIGATKINSSSIIASDGMNISAGSQALVLNGMTIDANSNVTIPGSISAVGTSFIKGQAQAFAYFVDTGSGCASSIITQEQVNIQSIVGSKGRYVITFAEAFQSTTYAPIVSLSMQSGGGFGAPYLVYTDIKLTDSVSIICLDLQGNLCAPKSGVSVAIFSQIGFTQPI